MRAAIYCRVSTKAQKEDGTSLETQLPRCQAFAKEHGYDTPEHLTFLEDWSGATLDRPQLEAVRNLIRGREVQALIVYSTDRLARNPIHIAIIAEECQKNQVLLLFVTEPLDSSPEGKLILYVKGYAAQIEREKFADRSLRGKKARARHGKIPGGAGINLYGYDYIKGKNPGQGIRVINEAQAEVVRMIFRWLIEERMTLYALCARLDELGIPSPKATTRWGTSTVSRILRNPAYTGKTYSFKYESVEPCKPISTASKRYGKVSRRIRPSEQWIEIPGATPAIISEQVFNLAQEQLRKNLEKSPRNQKHRYLLSSHIKCGLCGRRYAGYPNGNGYLFYRCPGRSKVVSIIPCSSKLIKAHELESLVWDEIRKVLTQPELVLTELQRFQDETENKAGIEDEITLVDRNLERIGKAVHRLVRLYEMGEIDDDYILRENAKLKQDKQRLIERKNTLSGKLRTQAITEYQLSAIKDYCERVSKNIENLSFEDKRLALEALGIEVIVKDDGISVHGAIPILASSITSTQPSRQASRSECQPPLQPPEHPIQPPQRFSP